MIFSINAYNAVEGKMKLNKLFLSVFLLFAFSLGACNYAKLSSANQMPVLAAGTPEGVLNHHLFTGTPVPSNTPAQTSTVVPSSTPKNTRTPRPSMTPSVTIPALVSYGPLYFPDDINPLTGLRLENPGLLDRRPIAMKIPNIPRSVRPQYGVSFADHVYEYYLEWGLTRFVAIFYGNDVIKAGPIRSARFFDENIFRMYKSVFVFNGADDQVEKYLMETDYKNLFVVDRDCPPLCRDKSIKSYNNLFGNTEQITEYINKRGVDNSRQDLTGLYFRNYNSRSSEYADRVFVRYSMFDYHYWQYDPIKHKYVRYQDAVDARRKEDEKYTVLTDKLTNKPITADNLVVLFIPHSYYLKSSDTEIFQMDFKGKGKAYFFREGYAYEGLWERVLDGRLLSILLKDGNPAPFKPGNTWFIIINDVSEMTHSGDDWRFDFVLPELPDDDK